MPVFDQAPVRWNDSEQPLCHQRLPRLLRAGLVSGCKSELNQRYPDLRNSQDVVVELSAPLDCCFGQLPLTDLYRGNRLEML
jgi:hypothetical protein